MVKCKYFANANITNILNIRKFFAIFFKKNSPSPPHSLIFAIKARGKPTSQRANESTSQRANESTSQRVEVRQVRRVRQVIQEMGLMGLMGPMGPKTKQPPKHPPKKNSLTRWLVDPLTFFRTFFSSSLQLFALPLRLIYGTAPQTRSAQPLAVSPHY